MAENVPESGRALVNSDIHETYCKLDQLDQRETMRWRLAMALVAGLCLLVILVTPAIALPHRSLSLIATILACGFALVFTIFAYRPQMRLIALRRELASQLGVVAALETLRLITGDTAATVIERRRLARASCDLRLTVVAKDGNNPCTYYGRVRDICEHGMGAIVPAALTVGEHVKLSFTVDEQTAITVEGTVRQRNGVRYGFEFSDLTSEQCETIERLWIGEYNETAIATGAGH